MSRFLHENYIWLIPVVFGGLWLILTFGYLWQREREIREERRIMEELRRRGRLQ